MYIAIEGIKGIGKSSIYEGILPKCRAVNFDFQFFPITAPIKINNSLEKPCFNQFKFQLTDSFVEMKFVARAEWHLKKLVTNDGIVLGDRSIITSYVTRWDKWNDPLYTIKRVNLLQRSIPQPDVIVWIQGDAIKASENIRNRESKNTGKNDETLVVLLRAAEIYQELFEEQYYNKKIKTSQLIILPNTNSIDELSNEVFSIFEYYNNKK